MAVTSHHHRNMVAHNCSQEIFFSRAFLVGLGALSIEFAQRALALFWFSHILSNARYHVSTSKSQAQVLRLRCHRINLVTESEQTIGPGLSTKPFCSVPRDPRTRQIWWG